MNNLKKNFNWIKEKFKKDEIKISLEHSGYVKNLFESNDNERKFECFLDLFIGSLFLAEKVDVSEFMGIGYNCDDCGEILTYKYDVENAEILDYVRSQETNELERGLCTVMNDYSFEIKFPTGTIICDDRLPNSYDMLKKLDVERTLNSNSRIKEKTLSYATENIFYVRVGNTCPYVFKKDNVLYVGHSSDNEYGDCRCGQEDCDCDYEEYPPVEGAVEIASICTDLWWASIVDIATYEKLLIDYFGEEQGKAYIKKITPAETKIKPGVYKCTYHVYDVFNEIPNVYAKLEWVREI